MVHGPPGGARLLRRSPHRRPGLPDLQGRPRPGRLRHDPREGPRLLARARREARPAGAHQRRRRARALCQGQRRDARGSNEEAVLVGDLKTVREQIKELEAQEKAIASKIILAIGADTGITIAGKKAATYKAQTSRRFDSTAFKADDPETYAAYCKPSSFRVLRVA